MAAAAGFLTPAPIRAAAGDLSASLLEILKGSKTPAIAALAWKDGTVVAEGAAGVRAAGGAVPVTPGDLWHIGSNAKAMTAVLIARLIEKGRLRFDMTLGEGLPMLAAEMNQGYAGARLLQLLSHTAGVPANLDAASLESFRISMVPLDEQRIEFARLVLGAAPLSAPGEKQLYSNSAYVLAAAMAEQATGLPFEELIQREVFDPLAITSAGFGAPGREGAIDQPLGNANLNGEPVPQAPTLAADNARVLAPAGTLHLSLRDWAKFAAVSLKGARGDTGYLSAQSWKTIFTPVLSEPQPYALGWIIDMQTVPGSRLIAHEGSNTLWHAMIGLLPEAKAFVLAAVNFGEGRPQALAAFNALMGDVTGGTQR
ncbi:MAG: beta-lactamase family protein [Alphaproteobacteria bacterium]|nr:beta-lactamase family protein [Alphaproteobacteria bacterium]